MIPNTSKSVLHLIDSSGMYGAENVLLTLLEELRNSGFLSILGCIREKKTEVVELAEKAMEKGIPVYYFTMKRGLNPFGIYRIMRFVNENRIGLVHSHGYKPNIFFAILPYRNFPVISTAHGWLKEGSDIKGKVYEFLDSKALKRLDCVVGVSEAVKKELVKRGVSDKKIVIIYNGIKTEHFQNRVSILRIRSEYLLNQDDFVIGTVGRLSKEKGHAYFIQAGLLLVKEIKNIKLIIAGDGPLKKDLEILVEKLELSNHVKLVGYVKNIEKFLPLIDVFVLPSLTEGLPISLLEAMAIGKPIIASNVGGVGEVIQNDFNGIMIPPMDSKAIANSIRLLYYDMKKREEISVAGKECIKKKFSSRSMSVEYQKLYGKMLSLKY